MIRENVAIVINNLSNLYIFRIKESIYNKNKIRFI